MYDTAYKLYLKKITQVRNERLKNKIENSLLLKKARIKRHSKHQKETGQLQATHIVSRMVCKGQLPSLKINNICCVDCGCRATDYDHRDYNKPREVEPVCRKCNLKRGRGKYINN